MQTRWQNTLDERQDFPINLYGRDHLYFLLNQANIDDALDIINSNAKEEVHYDDGKYEDKEVDKE